MPSKTLQRLKQEKAQKGAASPQEWRELARKAQAAAERNQDKRALGIKAAIEQNRIPQVLRAMHVICENDILREFPASST
jgi:hypothetical protein